MTRSCPSIRALATGAFLLALIAMATPAAADAGTASALEAALFTGGLLGDVSTQCEWWYTWC